MNLKKKFKTKKVKNNLIASIIIPTLNEEKNIVNLLKILNNQTIPRKDYEIILSDSSSDDNTVKLSKKLVDKLVICKRKGAGYGRNFGAKYAKGKYLGFIDGDTIVTDTWIEGLIESLNKGVGATGPLTNIERESFWINQFFVFWDLQAKVSTFLGKPIISGFNFGIRKKEFNELKGFDESNRLYEDMHLSFRLVQKGKIIFSNKMKVYTSSRRQQQIPLHKCVTMGLKYILTNKTITWEEYRPDFKKNN